MEAKNIQITKISRDGKEIQEDLVAVEARYQVRISDKEAYTFTCSPMDMEEMVTGSLFSRGYINGADGIADMEITGDQIKVQLKEKTADAKKRAEAVELDEETIFQTVKKIFSDPDTLFNRTGCAHSCSLMQNGVLLCTFEDIGRHNALDKVIGYALINKISMESCVIFTSGRVSGDYMEKILHAGIPVAVSRAAVTSEAVHLAKEQGAVLYGFVRGNSANRYS